MAIVYYYTKASNSDNFLQFGIRLSQNFSKEVNISGYIKQCISGLLNPKDDEEKFESNFYDCLKLCIPNEYCRVIDASDASDDDFSSRSVAIDKYVFGTFKNPEVVIITSVLPENISIVNKTIDAPVLFSNSRDLFYDRRNREMIDELSSKELYVLLKRYFEDKK